MLSVLQDSSYRHLFLAQAIALMGTGLATVALGLLAYDMAGADAGAVLGTALAIKMVAYIGARPIANAFADRLPRRAFLVSMDLVRAAVALMLPFVTEIWQVYLLIFLLQSASAAFTPAFQAAIPDVLPDEARYTRALSLSRLAYDLESLVSPLLPAALLSVISFHWLFGGTALGFLASAALVVSVFVPQPKRQSQAASIYARTTRGSRIYLKTPRLRGLLALNLAAAAGGAMVIVNTVVYVRSLLGRTENDVAAALAAFGAGSMLAALALPRLLERLDDRKVMVAAAVLLAATLLATAAATFAPDLDRWTALLVLWPIMGVGYSAVLTPSGRLLRRSASAEDRSAVFAAQFALSHACWLVAYVVAGAVGARIGLGWTSVALAILAALGVIGALAVWSTKDPDGTTTFQRPTRISARAKPWAASASMLMTSSSTTLTGNALRQGSRPMTARHLPRPWLAGGVVHLAVGAAIFSLVASAACAHGVAEGDKGYIQESSGVLFAPFVYLGAKHMVTGYNHLLFLAGVIFFLYRLKDISLYVTMFAAGHSVTLLAGVLSGISVNAYLIDAIIGLSVV